MTRITKSIIWVMILVASIIGINSMMGSVSLSNYNWVLVLILAIIALVSVLSLISLSRSGWKMEGPDDEWTLAAFINPMILIFRDNSEKLSVERRDDLEKDDDYFRHRQN